MDNQILQVSHLSKSFGSHEVLRDIDFTVNKGDVTSIIGASGSGKSTLLRCINLLEQPTAGQILYHGENVAAPGFNAPAYRSHVGMIAGNTRIRKEVAEMDNQILQVSHLSKSFGSHEVLRDIDFTVNTGDVTSLIGASGSGKSTLLRCINLLEQPTAGQILYHGENVAAPGFNAPAYRSHVGMVFQSFNLFNNMSVLDNCMVGQVKVYQDKKGGR